MTNQSPFRPEDYRNYLKLLARLWIPRQLRGQMDPSDLANEALVRAHGKINQFRGQSDGQFKHWLRTIMKNRLLDHLPERSASHVLEKSFQSVEDWMSADQSTPSARAMRNEQLERLAESLASLPDDWQEVVIYRHLLGWRVKHIAEHLGCSDHAVAGKLRRALEELRRQLVEE